MTLQSAGIRIPLSFLSFDVHEWGSCIGLSMLFAWKFPLERVELKESFPINTIVLVHRDAMHVLAFVYTLLDFFENTLQDHKKHRPFLCYDELLTCGKIDVDIQVQKFQGVEADSDDADQDVFISDGSIFLEEDDVLQK